MIGLDRSHQLRAEPACRAEEVVQRQPPDGVRVEQHQAGQDPDAPPAASDRPGVNQKAFHPSASDRAKFTR